MNLVVADKGRSYNFGMSYRGIVKSGVVVLEPNARLTEGQAVEVTELVPDELPAAGLWKDQASVPDAAAESLRLRRGLENREA